MEINSKEAANLQLIFSALVQEPSLANQIEKEFPLEDPSFDYTFAVSRAKVAAETSHRQLLKTIRDINSDLRGAGHLTRKFPAPPPLAENAAVPGEAIGNRFNNRREGLINNVNAVFRQINIPDLVTSNHIDLTMPVFPVLPAEPNDAPGLNDLGIDDLDIEF